MKTLIIFSVILSLYFCQNVTQIVQNTSQPTDNTTNDYVPISSDVLSSNYAILEILNYGVDFVLAKAAALGDISDNVFDVTRIYAASQRVLRTRIYYKFQVKLDDHENTIVNTTFTVDVRNGTTPVAVVSYKYNSILPSVNFTDASSLSGYTLIDSANYTDTFLQDLLNFGINYILTNGNSSGVIPTGNYSVSSVTAVYEKLFANTSQYLYNAEFKNTIGNIVILTNFTVKYNEITSVKNIGAYSYRVRRVPVPVVAANNQTNANQLNATQLNNTELNTTQVVATQNIDSQEAIPQNSSNTTSSPIEIVPIAIPLNDTTQSEASVSEAIQETPAQIDTTQVTLQSDNQPA